MNLWTPATSVGLSILKIASTLDESAVYPLRCEYMANVRDIRFLKGNLPFVKFHYTLSVSLRWLITITCVKALVKTVQSGDNRIVFQSSANIFFQFVARFPPRFRALGAEILAEIAAVDSDCPKAPVVPCGSLSDDMDIFVYLAFDSLLTLCSSLKLNI